MLIVDRVPYLHFECEGRMPDDHKFPAKCDGNARVYHYDSTCVIHFWHVYSWASHLWVVHVIHLSFPRYNSYQSSVKLRFWHKNDRVSLWCKHRPFWWPRSWVHRLHHWDNWRSWHVNTNFRHRSSHCESEESLLRLSFSSSGTSTITGWTT